MPKGKRQVIDIGPVRFETQTEAVAHVSEMLRTLPQRVPLGDPHDSFLRDLLLRHPRATEKIKSGIKHFTIDDDHSGYVCFHLHRLDGSRSDFSFHKCLKGERQASLALGALRNAVADQVERFRDQAYQGMREIPCSITGVLVAMQDCHVDHAPPNTFNTLVYAWLAREQLRIDDIQVSLGADNQVLRRLLDASQSDSWRSFHESNARLRVTTAPGNLSLSKLQHSGKI